MAAIIIGALFEPSKLRRCFYEISKETLEQHQSLRSTCFYLLDCLLFLYSSFRLLFFAYVMQTDFEPCWYNFRVYDIPMNYIYLHQNSYDSFIVLSIFAVNLFSFACHSALYFLRVNTLTWQWWHQLVVINQDRYYQARITDVKQLNDIYERKFRQIQYRASLSRAKHLKLFSEFFHNLYYQFRVKLEVWLNMDNVNKKQLLGKPLSVLPNLSNKLRMKLILLLISIDKICLLAQIANASTVIFYFISIRITYDSSTHPWYSIVCFLVELLILYYGMARVVRYAMFFTLCSIFQAIVYTSHVIKVGSKVLSLMRSYRRLPKRIPARHTPICMSQLREHNLICYLVVCGSKQLFGSILFAFLLSNIPFNVYLIGKNVFVSQSYSEQSLFWLVVLCQLFAASVVIALFAWCCSVYHSPKRFIPKLQSMISGKCWLFYKLKYDDLYSRLLTGPKIAISIGPMKSVTYLSAFELLLGYICYVLMAFKQQINSHRTH